MMIDKSTVEQARNADLIAFFEKYHGFTFAPRGGEYRCQQHKSLAVKADRRSFYWHSKGVGGFGVLDYLVKVENMPFREAVGVVAGTTPITAPIKQTAEPPKTLILPEKAGVPLRLYDYLCKRRGIDGDIVNTLIQKEMLYEDRRGNVVFVGYDEHNKARFACLRGTHGDCQFRGDCAGSDKRYGFSVAACAPSERLYLYESAIDLMSHASLENADTGDTGAWKRHNRLSLAGTSDTAIPFFLNQHKAVKELVFCLDNDPAGREATAIMARKYAAKTNRKGHQKHGKECDYMNTIDTRVAPRPASDTTIPAITRKLGNKTYEVYVHFSKTSKETMTDKIMRLVQNDINTKSLPC